MVDAGNDAGLVSPTLSARSSPPLPVDEVSAFYLEAAEPAYQAVRIIGGGHDEARDAVSAAVLDVLARWHEIQQPVGYLRQAAMNLFIKARVREAKLPSVVRRQRAGEPDTDDGGMTIWENAEWVDSMLACLPPQQQAVMRKFIEGNTTAEISAVLGKTAGNVLKNLQLARQKLADEHARRAEVPRQRGLGSSSSVEGEAS